MPPNGAVSVVPASACSSSWSSTSSLVTVASSCAIVVESGVADSTFVASVVLYDFSALDTASVSAVIVAWS